MERDDLEQGPPEGEDEIAVSDIQVSWEATFDWDNEYTEDYFNGLYIDVYDSDGYPFMDYYEYVDACINNSEVDRVRREYFRRKAERERAKTEQQDDR